MIDILQKLREYQEAGHKIDDAIANVEKTNPTEGKFKEIDTAQKERARLKQELSMKKQEYNAAMAGQGPGVGNEEKLEDEIEALEKELGISREGKEMKKDKMNESVMIATDTPEEASMMMQILKLAGVKPVDSKMIGAQGDDCGCTDDCPCGGDCGDDCNCDNCGRQEENFANEPEEKTQSVDDLVNTHSGGLNRQKQTFPKVAGGDNPMQKTTEDLANSLREQYNSFKEAYQNAVSEAKKKD